MSKALKDLTAEELDDYCEGIARSAEESRVVGGPLPAVTGHASEGAAREAARRWGLT